MKEHLSEKLKEDYKSIELLLNGKFKDQIDNLFLTQNNNVDGIQLKEIAKKWTAPDSIYSNAFAFLMGFSLLGTSDVSILKDDKILPKFDKVSNWALYTMVGSLGLIYKRSDQIPIHIKEIKVQEGSDYAQGGLLFAQGISNFGEPLNPESLQRNLSNL